MVRIPELTNPRNLPVKIIVEGGFDSSLKTRLRQAFSKLFSAKFAGKQPSFVAGGSRANAFSLFEKELRRCESLPLLLVDSEDVLSDSMIGKQWDPWKHVAERDGDGWKKPKSAHNDHLHFMVVMMESWILAEFETLKAHLTKTGCYNTKFQPPSQVHRLNKDLVWRAFDQVVERSEQRCRENTLQESKKNHHSDLLFDLLGKMDIDTLLKKDSARHIEWFIQVVQSVSPLR